MPPTARQHQQSFYDLYGYKDRIMWDIFEPDQKQFLKTKIKKCSIHNDAKLNSLTDVIWKQRKYTNGTLFFSIIYVIGIDKCVLEAMCSIYTVFRVRKCLDNSDSSNCCMIFIDENGRVYHTWKKFITENVIPNNFSVAPKNGIYNGDSDEKVILETFSNPSSSSKNKLLRASDAATGIVGLGAAVITIGSIVVGAAVAPVVLSAVGIGCGIYSTTRSAERLIDKSQHEQDISLSNADSRACWLGVVGGSISLGAGAATKLISNVAGSGKNVYKIFEYGVDSLNVAALTVNGIGVLNGMITLYYNEGKLTLVEFVQVSSSLVLFTHSVCNFQMSATIMNNARDQTIQQYRSELSKNQRRAFKKMELETIRVKGTNAGKQDIIRGLKNIPDRKAYFRDVYKVNKELNRQQIKISFGKDGQGVLNNEVKFVPKQLRADIHQSKIDGSLTGGKSSVFSDVPKFDGKNYIPVKCNLISSSGSQNITIQQNQQIMELISDIARLYTVCNPETLKDFLNFLAKHFINKVIEKLINLTKEFLREFADYVEQILKRCLPFEECLIKFFNMLFKLADEKLDQIERVLKEKVEQLFDRLLQLFDDEKNSSTNNNNDEKIERSIKEIYIQVILENETKSCNIVSDINNLIGYTLNLNDETNDEYLSSQIITKIIKLAAEFNQLIVKDIEKDLDRVITFDDNYVDMINLIFKKFANESFNQFESVLDSMDDIEIFGHLSKFYRSKNTYSNPSVKCKQCNGKYYN